MVVVPLKREELQAGGGNKRSTSRDFTSKEQDDVNSPTNAATELVLSLKLLMQKKKEGMSHSLTFPLLSCIATCMDEIMLVTELPLL
jgi:hypothetical protein